MTHAALRRAIHVASGAVLLPISAAPPLVFRSVIAAAAVAVVALDLARLRWLAVHDVLSGAIPVFRPAERWRLSGASWLMLGYAGALAFGTRAAAAGIVVGAVADPAAVILGERLGGGRPKSWVGTLAAFVTGSAVCVGLGLPVHVAGLAAAAGAAAERWSGRVDDNLLVAPVVAAAVALLA